MKKKLILFFLSLIAYLTAVSHLQVSQEETERIEGTQMQWKRMDLIDWLLVCPFVLYFLWLLFLVFWSTENSLEIQMSILLRVKYLFRLKIISHKNKIVLYCCDGMCSVGPRHGRQMHLSGLQSELSLLLLLLGKYSAVSWKTKALCLCEKWQQPRVMNECWKALIRGQVSQGMSWPKWWPCWGSRTRLSATCSGWQLRSVPGRCCHPQLLHCYRGPRAVSGPHPCRCWICGRAPVMPGSVKNLLHLHFFKCCFSLTLRAEGALQFQIPV